MPEPERVFFRLFSGVPRMRRFVLALEGLLALNAIAAGVAFVIRPDGVLLGMTRQVLVNAPFSSFFVPGLLLAGVIGGLNLWAFIATLRKSDLARLASLLAGASAVVFEAVESTMIPYSWLQPGVAAWGLVIVAAAVAPRKRSSACS